MERLKSKRFAASLEEYSDDEEDVEHYENDNHLTDEDADEDVDEDIGESGDGDEDENESGDERSDQEVLA